MRGICPILRPYSMVVCSMLAVQLVAGGQSTATTKPTPLILAPNDGERREFRMRPSVTFILKVDRRSSGSQHLTVVSEDMGPGDKILVHRHPHADELILIESGTGRVTLGDKVQEAHAGAMVYIPGDTWIGLENIGKDHLRHSDVWSAPGFEEYMRAISVPVGEPVVPLSKAELAEIRKKYSHFGVYQ